MKNNQLKLILPAIFLMIMVGIHAAKCTSDRCCV